MFAYSSDDKSWHGMFSDNQGRVHIFEGKVAQGSAEFTGPSRGPNGQTVLNRIKVVRVAANKVEQSWEKSTDNGATWTIEFQANIRARAREVKLSAAKKGSIHAQPFPLACNMFSLLNSQQRKLHICLVELFLSDGQAGSRRPRRHAF